MVSLMNCKKHNHIETSACAYTCPWCEIERLRRDERLWRNRVDEAAKRIEELEKALGQALNMRQEIIDKVIAGKHCHIITTDQIRTAWAYAFNHEDRLLRSVVLSALQELGIVRCECADHGLTHGESGPCVLCNGEGWVKE